ncbi:PH domain-containing protein [Streptomyces sp. E11-3]|uniref:PH domain-containing protein n=1 Tax=Streptomyces sp. E11-3 TaxID=3110112 RepID=UPI00397EEB35
MPLPFLTADRAFGEVESDTDVALPYEDRDLWRRPYRPGPWRVGAAAVLLLLASYLLFAAMIIALAGGPPAAVTCAGGAAVVIAVALRMLRMGTWVSARGLRQVGFFLTRTLPWERVQEVRTTQQPVRWLGLPRTVQGQALVLVQQDGTKVAAPLLTDHNADFMARSEAFDRAADTVEAWAYEYRQVPVSA